MTTKRLVLNAGVAITGFVMGVAIPSVAYAAKRCQPDSFCGTFYCGSNDCQCCAKPNAPGQYECCQGACSTTCSWSATCGPEDLEPC